MTHIAAVPRRNYKCKAAYFLLMALVIFVSVFFARVDQSDAASLSAISDTMSRLQKSVASDHTIKFTTPSGAAGTGTTITLTFPAGFNLTGIDYTDIDLTHGASTGLETSETLADTPATSSWGAAILGQVLTLTHPTTAGNGSIAAGDKVIISIGRNATGGAANAQIVNPSSASTLVVDIGGSFADTGKFAVVVLDKDQVIVNAAVDPSITFSLTANSTDFGMLSPGIIDTADTDVTLQVGTNSISGYTISVKDIGSGTNPGLYSTATSALIGSADGTYSATANLTTASSGFGIQASCTAGCTTDTHIAANYRQTSNTVGGLTLAASELASFPSSLSADHTILVTHKAKSAATTPAGSYTDTITYIATGNF